MIVDANVAVYWSVETPFSAPSEAILGRSDLKAPDFIMIETAEALLKHFRVGALTLPEINEGLALVRASVPELIDAGRLLPKAVEIAADLKHRVYDCLYLALALERGEPLATANRRLAGLAKQLSIETHLIEPA